MGLRGEIRLFKALRPFPMTCRLLRGEARAMRMILRRAELLVRISIHISQQIHRYGHDRLVCIVNSLLYILDARMSLPCFSYTISAHRSSYTVGYKTPCTTTARMGRLRGAGLRRTIVPTSVSCQKL